MQCFHLTFSRGLEKFVYDEFGEHRHSKEDYFYPDAYSLLFVAESLDKAKSMVRRMFASPLGKYDHYLLIQFSSGACDAEHAGLECRLWLERHGISV